MANYKYDVDGERLRAERERLGLTAEDVAALLGVSRSLVQKAERGANPGIDFVYRFSLLAGVDNKVFFK